jgi:DNA-3-methyladenine glycosylase
VTRSDVTSAPDRLGRDFYARPTVTVARELLGQVLVHVDPAAGGARRSGRIVETEAYVGPDDLASHARVGPKGRAAIMWGQPGLAYVYLVYGMHHCFNTVTETDGYPGAVLIRAIEPLTHAERGNGPALVCRSLSIDRSQTGVDLTTSADLFVEPGTRIEDARVRVGPRIGVDYAGEWAARPWRFWIEGSPSVSRPRVTGLPLDPTVLGSGQG